METKTVVMSMEIEIAMNVPEDWDANMCEFHKNESSWCSSSILSEIQRIGELGCICDITEFTYLREATKEDKERFDIKQTDIT